MSQSAPGGQYVLQQQSLTAQGPQTPGGVQQVQIAPATAEVHYGYNNIQDGTTGSGNNPVGALQVDGPTSPTLANRISMEFYNSGANDVEVSTDKAFTFGVAQARTIKPGASWSVLICPANISGGVKHYTLCGSGNVCKLEVSEVGQ
jgi:hypothetical protein